MNVVLTGFMATGKSSVGRALAGKLGMKFVDTDALIEKKTGMKIKDIFRKYGEKKFRDIETSVIRGISKKKGLVIATGGGAVLRGQNIIAFRKGGVIVNLRAGRKVILSRVLKTKKRPLLDPAKIRNVNSEIKKLLEYRRPFYAKCDFTLRTNKTTPEAAAKKIAVCLRKNKITR
jgi:shikimate kinase